MASSSSSSCFSPIFPSDFSASELRTLYYIHTEAGRAAASLLSNTTARIHKEMRAAVLHGQRTQEFTIPLDLPRELGMELLSSLSDLQFVIQYSYKKGGQEVSDTNNKWSRYDLTDHHVNPFNGSVFLRLCV
jgi:hypothetical protein